MQTACVDHNSRSFLGDDFHHELRDTVHLLVGIIELSAGRAVFYIVSTSARFSLPAVVLFLSNSVELCVVPRVVIASIVTLFVAEFI